MFKPGSKYTIKSLLKSHKIKLSLSNGQCPCNEMQLVLTIAIVSQCEESLHSPVPSWYSVAELLQMNFVTNAVVYYLWDTHTASNCNDIHVSVWNHLSRKSLKSCYKMEKDPKVRYDLVSQQFQKLMEVRMIKLKKMCFPNLRTGFHRDVT